MHRFFIPPNCIEGESVILGDDVGHQLAAVLRARPGEQIVVLDDSGWEYIVTLERVSPRVVQGRIAERLPARGEPGVRIVLYQAVLKANKFDMVLQKGTELGVSRFVPVFCARSVPRDGGKAWSARRHERWRKIVSEAAEQSHRGRLPLVESAIDFSEACDAAEGLGLIPWEEEAETGLKEALGRLREDRGESPAVSILTGPEGGFTSQEVDYARTRGIVPVSLGSRILRAETAPVATVSAVLYELGELGG